MKDSTRKITHYCIKIKDISNDSIINPNIIDLIFSQLMRLQKQDRKFDMIDKNKFHLIYGYKSYETHAVGFFKSAKYNYRPGLIDRDSLEERDNPKKNTEGEGEVTHFSIRFMENEAYLLLESKRDGIGITAFKTYIEIPIRKLNKNHTVNIGILLKEDFQQKLENLQRVMRIEAYTPYEQVVDTFGPIPIDKGDIKENAVIKFTAKKQCTLEGLANVLYQKLTNNNDSVSRLRIYGKTENDSDILLDTEALKDHDIIAVKIDENRQVVSSTIIPRLKILAENRGCTEFCVNGSVRGLSSCLRTGC